jgi:DNA-directed RNA polymerase specialized sigma24 family protein
MAGKMKKPTFIREGEEGKFSLASALVSDDSREIEQRDASEDISSMLAWLQGHNPEAADLMRLVLQGKSIPEIAALQGKNVQAVHSQYRRTLAQWRKQF